MAAAGINPILAARFDATSPPGAALNMISPTAGVGQAAHSAAQASLVSDQSDKIKQETDLIFEQWLTQTHEADIRAAISDFTIWLKQLELEEAQLSVNMMKENLKVARRMGEVSDTTFGLWMRYLGEATGAVGNIFRGSANFRGR